MLLQHVGGMKSAAARQAWREKMTIFSIYVLFALFFCFWLEFISTLFCDPDKPYLYTEIFSNHSHYAAINGRAVDWSHSASSSAMAAEVTQFDGYDASPMFPLFMQLYRPAGQGDYADSDVQACIGDMGMSTEADTWLNYKLTHDPGYQFTNGALVSCPFPNATNITGASCYYQSDQLAEASNLGYRGAVIFDDDYVANCSSLSTTNNHSDGCGYVFLDNNVLDVTAYLEAATTVIPVSQSISSRSFAPDRMFLPLDLSTLLFLNIGEDITPYFDGNVSNADIYRACLPKLFMHGISANKDVDGCTRFNPALWATMGCGLVYFLIKMTLTSLSQFNFVQRWLFKSSFGSNTNASSMPYTVLMMPCFAESSEVIRQTIDSLSRTSYDDSKKLLLIICDGVVKSAHDAKETHLCVLDALGHSSMEEAASHSYVSLGQNGRRINYAKVYSGFYEVERHRVPFMVIVKVGGPGEISPERRAPGNRGKRDSMLLFFSFLERCMDLQHNRITPLEYELFHQCYSVLGIDPREFKYMFMADADTQVQVDVVDRLVDRLERDPTMLAISGQVRPANPEQNIITMLQVFPLYTTYFSALAYEACLGSVTTINGGIVLYKLWTRDHPLTEPTLPSNQSWLKRLFYKTPPHPYGQSKWPKVSDEFYPPTVGSPSPGASWSTARASAAKMATLATLATPASSCMSGGAMSRLSFTADSERLACCIHPTVLRGFATPAADTMHMKNVLLLGEEQYLGAVLLRSHPGYRLGFEPKATGYVTLPTNFFSLQSMITRNLRSMFHNQIEIQQMAHHLGWSYWILATTKILDLIFSMPIMIYLYGVYGHFFNNPQSLAYAIIAGSFGGLFILHVLFFVIRRQFKYVLWLIIYCLFSVPLFAIYFPLLAAWTTDYCERWFDVWPTSGSSSFIRPGRLHGLVDEHDEKSIEFKQQRRHQKTEESDNEKRMPLETIDGDVMRLRIDEYERIEAQKVDANFLGFAGVVGRTPSMTSRRSVVSQDDSMAMLLPPPQQAQIKEASRRSSFSSLPGGHTSHHRRGSSLEDDRGWAMSQVSTPSGSMINPFADSYELAHNNPFNDDVVPSTKSTLSIHSTVSSRLSFDADAVDTHVYRRPQAHASSSYDEGEADDGRAIAVHHRVGLTIPERSNILHPRLPSPAVMVRHRFLRQHHDSDRSDTKP